MSEQKQSLKQIIQFRRDKLDAIRAAGVNPYPYRFDATHTSISIKENYAELENQDVTVAGRIMSLRVMGKASFVHIQDQTGRIQSYVRRDDVGADNYQVFKKLDIGDILGVSGYVLPPRPAKFQFMPKRSPSSPRASGLYR